MRFPAQGLSISLEVVTLDRLVSTRREERTEGEAKCINHIRMVCESRQLRSHSSLGISGTPHNDRLVRATRKDAIVCSNDAPDSRLVAHERGEARALPGTTHSFVPYFNRVVIAATQQIIAEQLDAVRVVCVPFEPSGFFPLVHSNLDDRTTAMRKVESAFIGNSAVDTLVETDDRALTQRLLEGGSEGAHASYLAETVG
mmetsp:Transcript_19256/g.32196  ORF Transcript_19256/g.32196 Transcript_19256/m.32196 type:complete len:200 (-) Transcript_19256:2005-2604(-)